MVISRRGLLGFLAVAPFVVRSASLMPVKRILVGDGISLFSIDHPGWANAPPFAELNEWSLERALFEVQSVVTERGERLCIRPTKAIWRPVDFA